MTAAEHNPHLEVLDAELVHELAVTGRNPAAALDVLDAQLVEPAPYRSPLDPNPRTGQYPTVLRGGRLTDLTEVEHVRVRAAYRRLPWWQRFTATRPAGYRVGWW